MQFGVNGSNQQFKSFKVRSDEWNDGVAHKAETWGMFLFFSCVSVILCASADTGQHLSLHVHDSRI